MIEFRLSIQKYKNIPRKYRNAIAPDKEIDDEKTDTNIIIRADIYRMCRTEQSSNQNLPPNHHG